MTRSITNMPEKAPAALTKHLNAVWQTDVHPHSASLYPSQHNAVLPSCEIQGITEGVNANVSRNPAIRHPLSGKSEDLRVVEVGVKTDTFRWYEDVNTQEMFALPLRIAVGPSNFVDSNNQTHKLSRGINTPIAIVGEYGPQFSLDLVAAAVLLDQQIAEVMEKSFEKNKMTAKPAMTPRDHGALTSSTDFEAFTQGIASTVEAISLVACFQLPNVTCDEIFEYVAQGGKNMQIMGVLARDLAFAHLGGFGNTQSMPIPLNPLAGNYKDGFELSDTWNNFLVKVGEWKKDPLEVTGRFGIPQTMTMDEITNGIIGSGCRGISLIKYILPALWQWYKVVKNTRELSFAKA